MVLYPSEKMQRTVQDIINRSMQCFKGEMKKLSNTLEQFDLVKDMPDSPVRQKVMQEVKDGTEDLMYLIYTLDELTNNLPDRTTLEVAALHDAFEVIHEIRRLITIRGNSAPQQHEVIQ